MIELRRFDEQIGFHSSEDTVFASNTTDLSYVSSAQDMEALEPTRTSLGALAKDNLPLVLPWHPTQAVKLGTFFHSRSLEAGQAPWATNSPFQAQSLAATAVRYSTANGDLASYRSHNTSSNSETDEHISVGLTASVGGALLGASVGGNYDKAILKNRDVRQSILIPRVKSCRANIESSQANKSSLRSTYRSGIVTMDRVPAFTDDALIKLKYNGGLAAFYEEYGDYYLAGYLLGGDTGLFMSLDGDIDVNDEIKTFEAKVKVVGLTKTHRDTFKTTRHSASMSFSFAAYDTLESLFVQTHKDQSIIITTGAQTSRSELSSAVERMTTAAHTLDSRTQAKISTIGLSPGNPVSYSRCVELLKSGVVVELLLLPAKTIREVLEWTTDDNVIAI